MSKSLKFLNYFILGILTISLTLSSCKKNKDDDMMMTEVSFDELNNLITEATGLLDGASEGFDLGQYQFGCINQLQEVIDNAQSVVDSQTDDMNLVANAISQLQGAMDAFRIKEVTSIASPWIQQIPDNRLLLTDSDNGTQGGLLSFIETGKDFTIELRINPVSLETLGFSNSLISAAKQFNGTAGDPGVESVDEGFHVRYFADGAMQFINGGAGIANSWQEIDRTPAGTLVAEEWQHVAYVHSGGDQILYVNGVEVGRGSFDYKSIGDIPGVAGISIGNAFDWTDRVSNTLVEDIRVWNKALAPSEMNDQTLTSTGNGLEAWFPFKSDQGTEVIDVSGNYKAVLGQFTNWAENGDITTVPVNYDDLNTAIMEGQSFLSGVVEGTSIGNYGIGTVSFVQNLIDAGNQVIASSGSQGDAATAATAIRNAIARVENNTIEESGSTEGLLYDLDAAGTVGFRLTRVDGENPALPEGSYTIELEARLNDFLHPQGAETSLLGTGALQFRTIVSPEGMPNANEGAIEFYVEGAGWTCACSSAGTMLADEWVQLAAVYDAGSNTSRIYLNGNEVASGPEGAYTRRDNNGWMDMWLGNRGGDGNRLDGSARNLRIWDVARSASEVNTPINGDESGLIMYFPLDVKNAPFFVDRTGNFYGERIGVSYL